MKSFICFLLGHQVRKQDVAFARACLFAAGDHRTLRVMCTRCGSVVEEVRT